MRYKRTTGGLIKVEKTLATWRVVWYKYTGRRNSMNGQIPEWPKGTDCKSAANCFGGSNPPLPISHESVIDIASAGVAE